MVKVKIGHVFEISTPLGLAYAQCTHRHHNFGHLIRVLPGLFKARPENFIELVNQPTVFSTFFPLQAAANQKIVNLLSVEMVPRDAQLFPIFRAGIINPASGKVDVWWLWDGEKEWRVGKISDEQRRLPLRQVWNDTLLIERIVSGWTPETDPR